MGNPAFMDTLFRSEVLIKLEKDSIWMPVQNQILNALKQEISSGDTISIYCLFLMSIAPKMDSEIYSSYQNLIKNNCC